MQANFHSGWDDGKLSAERLATVSQAIHERPLGVPMPRRSPQGNALNSRHLNEGYGGDDGIRTHETLSGLLP